MQCSPVQVSCFWHKCQPLENDIFFSFKHQTFCVEFPFSVVLQEIRKILQKGDSDHAFFSFSFGCGASLNCLDNRGSLQIHISLFYVYYKAQDICQAVNKSITEWQTQNKDSIIYSLGLGTPESAHRFRLITPVCRDSAISSSGRQLKQHIAHTYHSPHRSFQLQTLTSLVDFKMQSCILLSLFLFFFVSADAQLARSLLL